MFKNAKAKHGLNLKMGFKTNLVSFWRTKNGNEERRRGEGEEEEEEEKKKRRGGVQEGIKGMELWVFVWTYEFLYEFPYNCMISSLPQT